MKLLIALTLLRGSREGVNKFLLLRAGSEPAPVLLSGEGGKIVLKVPLPSREEKN